MARARNIKPGLFKNELLGEADPLYTLLFVGLWTIADKEGRLENRPKRIRAEIFPYKFDVDLTLALDWLKDESFIAVYEFEGKSYIQINNWKRHQTPHHKEVDSVIPSPEYVSKEKEKQRLAQEQAMIEASKEQEQSKESASSPLIPDSLITDSGFSDTGEETADADAPPPADEEPEAKPKPKPKRGTRIPDDWTLTDEHMAAMRDLRPELLPYAETIAGGFRDYWIAQPGQKGTKLDWMAVWRNWLRNEKTRGRSNATHQPNRKESLAERTYREAEEIFADIEARESGDGSVDKDDPAFRPQVAQ